MLARDYLSLYLSERDVSPEYKADLGYTLKILDRWAGHPLDVRELADDLANRWLTALQACMRQRSVKHHRTNLLSVWRGAADAGLTDTWPRRVRKIKVPRTLVDVWNLEQMRLLLAATEKLTGVTRRFNIRKSALYRSYTLVGFNSGLRPYDLWLLEFAEIGTNGTLVHIANKTGEVIMKPLWPETMAAIEAIALPERRRLFGDVLSLEALRRQFKAMAKSVGLTGTPKKLRKSGATAVEAIQEGAASKFLGHRTPTLAMQFYVDRRQLSKSLIVPPPLAS